MSSMNTVTELLSCDDINKILYFDNIVRDINNPFHQTNSRIIIKSMDCFISIHDLPFDYTNNDILNFIDMCKRRYNRIIEYIKSDEKICFIHHSSYIVDDNTINKFIQTILKINPKCNFNIVVIDNNKKNDNVIIKYENCLYIKLNVYNPSVPDWTKSFLNWEKIFLDIENNI